MSYGHAFAEGVSATGMPYGHAFAEGVSATGMPYGHAFVEGAFATGMPYGHAFATCVSQRCYARMEPRLAPAVAKCP